MIDIACVYNIYIFQTNLAIYFLDGGLGCTPNTKGFTIELILSW